MDGLGRNLHERQFNENLIASRKSYCSGSDVPERCSNHSGYWRRPLFTPNFGIIQQTFTGQARAKAFGLFGMVVAVSIAVGPVLAGILITIFGEQTGWRYTFFINGPIGPAGIILAFYWLPFDQERERIRKRREAKAAKQSDQKSISEDGAEETEKRKVDLDPIGALILVIAVLGIMYPFTSRSSQSWPHS